MSNIIAVYQRELKSYFSSQTFYVLAAVFMLVVGSTFRQVLFEFSAESMRILRYQWDYGAGNLNYININGIASGVFTYVSFILLLIVPLLTMRLYAEEKKTGTMELLMTSPVTTFQIMLGKFLSSFTIYTFMVLLTSLFMVILSMQSDGQLDYAPILSTYLGMLLFGAGLISIGMFASSLTDNQVIAAMMSLSISLGLWLLVFSSSFFHAPLNELVIFLSISSHLDHFKLGMIAPAHIVYYLSLSLFWLVLTWMSVESARWRQ